MRYEQERFSVAVPASWKRIKHDDRQLDRVGPEVEDPSERRYYGMARFDSPDGYSMTIEADGPETECYANGYWELSPDPTRERVVIAKEGAVGCAHIEDEEDCTPTPGFRVCGEVDLKGHHYTFIFGHRKRRDGVDMNVFRTVLKSFRAK